MKIIIIFFFTINSSFLFAQLSVTIERTVINNTGTGIWEGVNISRRVPTTFTYRNNSITSVNAMGYMLQAGDENAGININNLDGAIITGNKFKWNGTDATSITHALFTGYNINAIIKYNYLENTPMGIIRKSNSMTNTSGGIAYNIVNNPTKVAVVVKAMNNVNIYNNTFYSSRTPEETWRGIIEVYSNFSLEPDAPSKGTKIFNNIFYTKNKLVNISVYDTACWQGFESDYNIFYCEAGVPMFIAAGVLKTFAQWQALGYDTHSVVINPDFKNFTEFVPRARLDYGTNLGATWQAGLSAEAVWGTTDPLTTNQNGTWQVGARVHGTGREQYLEWFRESKFGMFIHWGPYSQLAGEWNGRQVSVGKEAEWIMKELTIPVNNYRELAGKMNPARFDAHEWVRLAKSAGMKYIVVTAKHHDGFAMYQSKASSYNIFDRTPFKRDPLKELSLACAEEKIKFCVYYSHREDWDHPGGYGNNWNYDNDWGDDFYDHEKFEKYLEEKAKPQLRELLTNYGPIGLVWFDRGMYTGEQGKDFVRLVNELQPSTLVNSRVGNYNQELLGDYQSMSDNGMPPGGLKEYWESAQTLNSTWGFSKFDTQWKSPETVIRRLVEIISRGGNYLLNIGPKGNGEIPDSTIEILRKVGPWVNRNAESIYETTANPFGELPWGYCTVKESKLYLFVRDWPKDGVLTVPGLNNAVTSAYLLLDKSTKLPVAQAEKQTRVSLPPKPIDSPITVLVLNIEGSPRIDPTVVLQDNTGLIELNYLTAITRGKTMTRFNRKGGFHISKWTGPEDSSDWIVHIDKPGAFQVNIDYAANKEWEGKQFEITIGSSTFNPYVIFTGDWFEYHKFPVGYIDLKIPGDYKVTIRPKISSDTYLMYLNSISLNPIKNIKKEGWSVN